MPSDYLYELGDVYLDLISERETKLVSIIKKNTNSIKSDILENDLCDSEKADRFIEELVEFVRNYKEI